jgi:hypothetical protein
MTGGRQHRSSEDTRGDARSDSGRAPGRCALTDSLPASGGAPLADDVRAPFEHVLLADLTGVRVHSGAESAAAAGAMGAHAFTVGNDIHMGAGKRTDDPFGMHLLAHEVAHTQQQAAGGVQVQCKSEDGAGASDAQEGAADQKSDAMTGAASPATAGLLLEFQKRAEAASAAMDAAKHSQVDPIRVEGTAPIGDGISFPTWFFDLQKKLHLTPMWGPACENAQKVLRDYAEWHVHTYCGGKPPPSVLTLINYAGRSSLNDASARSKDNQNRGTAHYLGQKGEKNWCTGTTTRGVLDGLAVLGLEPTTPIAKVGEWIQHVQRQSTNGETMRVGSPEAFTAPLIPGDLVMWIADGSQYGGHAVTVVEDFGGSFTHISGNTGPGVGVAIGEAQRLTTLPTAKSGNQTFNLGEANKSSTQAERFASNAYIKQFDFSGKMLVYSITRYGAMFQELGTLADLAPDAPERAELMAKYKLREKRGGPVAAETV